MRIDLQPRESIIIKPWHRVVILSHESLEIPPNILARVISKGSLFSIGLSAVCTQADPGFRGQLGIVTQNFSDKYIQINPGQSIAKIDFSLLTSDSTNLYNGQHGFNSNIWPIDTTLQKKHSEVSSDRRISSELEEAYKVLPKDVSRLISSLTQKQKTISYGLFILLLINTSTLALSIIPSKPLEGVTAITINIISQLIWAAFAYFRGSKDGT